MNAREPFPEPLGRHARGRRRIPSSPLHLALLGLGGHGAPEAFHGTGIRDSRMPDGAALLVTPAAFAAFVTEAATGRSTR
ncbi:DUF397 domain-containing protein [Streptomyces sp. NPDC002004]